MTITLRKMFFAVPLTGLLAFAPAAFAHDDDYGHENSHQRAHDYLGAEHQGAHDELEAQHEDAHQYPMTRRQHKRLHRALKREHGEAHQELRDQHETYHDQDYNRDYNGGGRPYGRGY